MNDQQLLRYSRQILLQNLGIKGQQKLLDSRVLIIGMGGLGSPVAMYLAAAGVGQLTLVDHDLVELSNLQRQIIHDTYTLDMNKVDSARKRAAAINPGITIHTINKTLDENELHNQVEQHDAVIDCSDNFPTRFLLNKICVNLCTPLISGAVIRMEGQIATFDFREKSSACYRCLYDETGEDDDTCSTTGVLAPVVGIIGSIQATETLKLLAGLPTLKGALLLLDALSMDWRKINLQKDPNCPVCSDY